MTVRLKAVIRDHTYLPSNTSEHTLP